MLRESIPPRATFGGRSGSLRGGILITILELSYGGADRVAILLANGFVAAGLPVGLEVLRDRGDDERGLIGMLDPRVMVGRAGAPTGSRHLDLVRGLFHIQRAVALTEPAVLLASSNNMGLVTGLSRTLSSAAHRPVTIMKTTNPVITTRDRSALRQAYRRRLYGSIFSMYDRVLTLSAAEQANLSRMFPNQRDKFEIVANPYVTPAMLEESAPEDRRDDHKTIVAVARLMPQKRLDVLLRAFARVRDRETRLVILGEGRERSRLETLAAELGIAHRTSMPGFTGRVSEWLRRVDLFVMSSDYEGWPAAVIEALACNLPVVTTDCFAGAHDLLGAEPGCAVVPKRDIDGLARAIDTNLKVPRTLALRPLAERYTIEQGVASHVAAVRAVIARQR